MAPFSTWRLDHEPLVWPRKPWGGHCGGVQGNRQPTHKTSTKIHFNRISRALDFIYSLFFFLSVTFQMWMTFEVVPLKIGKVLHLLHDSKVKIIVIMQLYWKWLENKSATGHIGGGSFRCFKKVRQMSRRKMWENRMEWKPEGTTTQDWQISVGWTKKYVPLCHLCFCRCSILLPGESLIDISVSGLSIDVHGRTIEVLNRPWCTEGG